MSTQIFNMVIQGSIAFMGAFILFALGLIVSYVRSMNKAMKDVLTMTIRHETKIEVHDKNIEKLFELYNKKDT